MTSPREEIRKRVREWVQLADEDIALAEHAMTMTPQRPYRLVAYHAQQCAEKYLKAFLVFREVDFPFTHNISTLLELCQPMAPWAEELTDAETLTSYGVTARYPGLDMDVNEQAATRAIAADRVVRSTVRDALHDLRADLGE